VLVLFVMFIPAYVLSVSLLFLMGSLFTAMLGYNILLARLSLGRLAAHLPLVPELFCLREHAVQVTIGNHKRWLSAHNFSVRLLAEEGEAGSAVLESLVAGQETTVYLKLRPERRGKCQLRGLALECGHPFGLVQATAVLGLEQEVIVYPALLEEESDLLQAESRDRGLVPLSSDDYQYLAAYQPGDDVRRIHWRKSTLVENPVLKKDLVRAEIVEPKLLITDACPHFEAALSLLTTRFHYGGQLSGWSVLTRGGIENVDSCQTMLTFLALASPLEAGTLDDFQEGDYKPLYLSRLPV